MKDVDYDKISDEDLMKRVEAARGYINGVNMRDKDSKKCEFEAFMSIFHPGIYKDDKKMNKIRPMMKCYQGER